MTQRASIASLLYDLDRRSPAGFAIALHIRFTTPTYLFQTYPKRWMDHYTSAGLHMNDPVVHWGLQNIGHMRWADLEAIDSEGVLEQAKDFGLMNGAIISVLISRSRSMAGFARADRDYSDAEMQDLEDTLAELHRVTAGLDRLSESDQHALTELSISLTH